MPTETDRLRLRLATVLPLIALFCVQSLGAQTVVIGDKARPLSSADLDRIREVCLENMSATPFRIVVQRGMGYQEHQTDPIYAPQCTTAFFLSGEPDFARAKTGITLGVTKDRFQNREDWRLEKERGRWVTVKRPAAAPRPTIWYDTPIPIDAKVTSPDVVEVVDQLFHAACTRDAFPNFSTPDASDLKTPIRGIGFETLDRERRGQMAVEIAKFGESIWQIVYLKKTKSHWTLAGAATAMASRQSTLFFGLTSKLSPKPPGARSVLP
jgi:hypothetical protein